MPSGQCTKLSQLPASLSGVLIDARRAVMTTVDADGRPHAVPVVFALYEEDIVTPIDRKPKSGRTLGRRRNLERDPNVTFLADRWSESWPELAWVMVRGRATLQPPERSVAEAEAIVARYPEYRDLLEDNEVIRIVPERISWWSWTQPSDAEFSFKT